MNPLATNGTAPDLRVLRLITRLNVGGPARQALLLSRDLHDEFPTTLASGYVASDEAELRDPPVPVSRVPLVRPVRLGADTNAFLAVRRLLVDTRAGLLHTHMAKAGAIGRSAALTLRPRPRTVHTFHGHVLDGYFGPAVQRTFVEFERRLARRTDALVAVSPEVRDSLLDLGIGRPEQVHVIPLGLDLAPLLAIEGPDGNLRRSLGLAPDTPLVGVIGRLVPIKDNHTLLLAIARLPGVHLAVIGDGPCRAPLERQARDAGIADRVHFTGWKSDVASVLSDIDVVALTSRNEGTPVSLIEAAAAGRPAVATEVGGVAAVVRHRETGYLVRPGDSQAVAARLGSLLDDPEARRRLGESGRTHVRDRFSHKRLVREIKALYRDLSRSTAPA